MDVPYRPGSNEWSRLVLGRLNGGKGTIYQGLDSEELGGVDLIHLHGMAFAKTPKRVGEKDFEEFQWLCILDEWDIDAPEAIEEQHILWKKNRLVCIRTYQAILFCNVTYQYITFQ